MNNCKKTNISFFNEKSTIFRSRLVKSACHICSDVAFQLAQATSFTIGPIDTVTVELTFILAHVVRKDSEKHSVFYDVSSVVVDVVLVA